MTKSETMKQLAAASNAARLAALGKQIEQVRQAKLESAEQLATMLEPLAQAMAALTDETRQTLVEIEHQSREQSAQFMKQIEMAAKAWKDAAAQTRDAAESLNRAGHRMEWTHYLVTLMTGLITAMLVSVFWLWLAPPSVVNQLDPKAVADYLRPAIVAVKRSNGK
jgi:tRNA G26 N,N-dimethylase Trm1